jgi:hypothetical protein
MERGLDIEGYYKEIVVFRSSLPYRMRRIWPVPFLGIFLYMLMFPFYLLFFTIADSYIYLLCMAPLLVGYSIVFVFRNQFYFTIRPPLISFHKDHMKVPSSEGFERPYVKIGYRRLLRLELVPMDHFSTGIKLFRFGRKNLGLGPEIASFDEVDIHGIERIIIHYRSMNVSGSSSVEVEKIFFRSEGEFVEFVNMMMNIGKGRRRSAR